ncbi:hypothetical protein NM208_g5441 [Fusarium decemcellulare]|uniref:Uncharacterized protein n=1 Tax=Fusarium decemcellulare TaxID=57161 RepID=A0ACC1SGX1_9HYPO|nr:hypothetical protein NM208_g5441 [Fusarium decemcellulare]
MSHELFRTAAWEASGLCTLYKQLVVGPKPLPQGTDLAGRTAIITGANSGLGLEAGRQLLRLHLSRLIIGVRSQTKGNVVASELRDEFPSAVIDVFIVDLTDYESIIEFRAKCQQLDRIDFMILNAGLMNSDMRRIEKTGHELVFQTNYLSTVLMVLIILPVLISKGKSSSLTEPPVLSIVGSDTMYQSTFTETNSIIATMDSPNPYQELPQYANTKLLLMTFVSRLSKEIKPEEVIINVCNPGLTSGTDIAQNDRQRGWFNWVLTRILLKVMARSLQSGASIYLHALLSFGKTSHGSFVSDWDIKPYAPFSYTSGGEYLSKALWQETLEELGFAKDLSVESLFSRESYL